MPESKRPLDAHGELADPHVCVGKTQDISRPEPYFSTRILVQVILSQGFLHSFLDTSIAAQSEAIQVVRTWLTPRRLVHPRVQLLEKLFGCLGVHFSTLRSIVWGKHQTEAFVEAMCYRLRHPFYDLCLASDLVQE